MNMLVKIFRGLSVNNLSIIAWQTPFPLPHNVHHSISPFFYVFLQQACMQMVVTTTIGVAST